MWKNRRDKPRTFPSSIYGCIIVRRSPSVCAIQVTPTYAKSRKPRGGQSKSGTGQTRGDAAGEWIRLPPNRSRGAPKEAGVIYLSGARKAPIAETRTKSLEWDQHLGGGEKPIPSVSGTRSEQTALPVPLSRALPARSARSANPSKAARI